MKFDEALKSLERGLRIKRKSWATYRDGLQMQQVKYSYLDITSEDWEVEPQNKEKELNYFNAERVYIWMLVEHPPIGSVVNGLTPCLGMLVATLEKRPPDDGLAYRFLYMAESNEEACRRYPTTGDASESDHPKKIVNQS
jgi:hypothetical protein